LKARSAQAVLPRDFEIIEAGVLRADPNLAHGERIGLLHVALHELMERLTPDACVMEKAFCDKNVSTALKLGEVRGAFIAAGARLGLPTFEITPAEVKKTITGNGRSEKELVSLSLKALMGFDRGTLPHDVTDAVAIALCLALRLGRGGANAPVGRAVRDLAW